MMGSKKEVDDRFKKFGTVSFTAISKTNDFIDYLEDDKVAGTKCQSCGLVFFPPRADCYQCLCSDMQWFEVAGGWVRGNEVRLVDGTNPDIPLVPPTATATPSPTFTQTPTNSPTNTPTATAPPRRL